MHTVVSEGASIPTLEPLSRSTGEMIRPLALNAKDFLLVDLDEKGVWFTCRPVQMEPADAEDVDCIFHEGERFRVLSSMPSYDASVRWISRVPEKKRASDSVWIGATDISALVLHHSWPHSRLVFRSEDARIYYLFLLNRFLSQNESARIVADYKVKGEVPEMPDDWIEHPEPNRRLMPQQRVGMMASLHRECYAEWMEQGTGKTATTIGRVCLESSRKRRGVLPNKPGDKTMYRVLIICPNAVRRNWENEFESFATVPGKVSILRGGMLGRGRGLIEGVREESDCAWAATICSHDSVASMLDYFKRVDWDLVVVDESHGFKNPNSKRFKTFRTLRSFPLVHQCMLLTGTPIANNVMDLYAQFEMMAEGMSGFSSFNSYKRFYGAYKKLTTDDGSSIEKLVGIKNAPMLQERIARVAFTVTKKEAKMNLPDKSYDIYEVAMTNKQTKIYNQMANHLAVSLGDLDDKTMSVTHVLTSLLRLAQITSGHVKWDAEIDPVTMEKVGAGVVEQIDKSNPKVDALIELLNDEGRDPLGKTIVWACWREDIRVICDRLKEEGIGFRAYHGGVNTEDRERAVRDFNDDPNVRVFVANAKTAGTGLNLVGYDWWNSEPLRKTYTDHLIFFSQNWSATERGQAEDRAHRKGVRQPVRITDLCTPGTIDEEIRSRVTNKLKTAMQIQDVKHILSQVLEVEDE